MYEAAKGSETSRLPTGTVTLLFTDIEGSTRLLQTLGESSVAVLAEHNRILRKAAAEQGGREIDSQGDSFLFAFERANAALGAAVLAQRALSEHSWPEGSEVRVRMGLHTGEPIVGEERYVGLGVHRAARIGAVAHGGQVLLSNATRELLEDGLAGVAIRDLGLYRLKDLDRDERLYQLDVAGLKSDFPPLNAPRVAEPLAASPTEVEVGAEFLGYRIEERIGQGGMGVVYRAYDLRLRRTVALKLVTPELALDERFRERFVRETELAMSLEHPNVVPVHDAGEVAGRLYLAMRLVAGTDLRKLLRAEGALEPARALAICRQIANALDAAHARALVHGDVKPSNVLLDESEHVYLADFGLTRRLEEQRLPASEGRSIGTPAYLAPERIEGQPVDRRADVYSLGCVFYECLTGEPPFTAGSRLAVAWAHLEEQPPSASERNPDLPHAIDAVIRKALAKSPQDRYPACASVITDAEAAVGLKRRRGRLLPLVAAVSVVLVAGAVAGAVLGLALLGGGQPRSGDAAESARVALILPCAADLCGEDVYRKPFTAGLLRAKRDYGLETETIDARVRSAELFDFDPRDAARVASRLRTGNFDLVIWAGAGADAEALFDEVPKHPETRFVYVDAQFASTELRDSPNATVVRFRDDQAAKLAGYLGGLVSSQRPNDGNAAGAVSVVGGLPSVGAVRRMVDGFRTGAERARPGVKMRVDYSYNFVDQAICERIANQQIDGGSRVVFTPAGTCGLGALSAAGLRSVWGIGVDEDRSNLGPHILASAVKRFDRALEVTVRLFLEERLGRTVVVGLEEEAVGLVGISGKVPAAIRRKVAMEAERLRREEAVQSGTPDQR